MKKIEQIQKETIIKQKMETMFGYKDFSISVKEFKKQIPCIFQEDLKLGQTVLARGHIMKPADLGLVASLGIATVDVFRPLKVAFFSTGDELVGVGKPLAEGQIYDSNRYTIFGM